MSKWYGKIGYINSKETEPGIYEDAVIEKDHFGELTADRRNRSGSNEINNEVTLSNNLSILATSYDMENYSYMAYATILGVKWKISSIEIEYPRLKLTIGGRYNEVTT